MLRELDCVDTVEPAIVSVVIGGRPLLPPPANKRSLVLTGHRVYKKSGIVPLTYHVARAQPVRESGEKIARSK